MIHGASLAFFNIFSLFFVFNKSGLCNLSSNLHFNDLSGFLSQLCLSFFSFMSLILSCFLFHHLLCHPTALPKCLHLRVLSPDLWMPMGASHLSHHLLHPPALNLSPSPHWFLGNNSTWDVGAEVGCINGGLSDRAFELSFTINLVAGSCNKPQVCCALHAEGNVQPVATEMMQIWRRKVLPWQQTPRALHPPVQGVWAKIPSFLTILVASSPSHRGAAPVLSTPLSLCSHTSTNREGKTPMGICPSKESVKRPKPLTAETWTERQSKLGCNSCLFLCKVCPQFPETFFYSSFLGAFLHSPAIYYTIKTDGGKCSSLRWEGFIWNTK